MDTLKYSIRAIRNDVIDHLEDHGISNPSASALPLRDENGCRYWDVQVSNSPHRARAEELAAIESALSDYFGGTEIVNNSGWSVSMKLYDL